ncbi:putative monocarboxylate transporter [Aspergillus ambiguus]|uniref:putative monocarboxylate transporter n=1 Tax=Aspergillus ambiguus TaxID=176160 RepID=UPI003CCE24A8
MSGKGKTSKSTDPPDGGLRAWLVASGGFAAQLCTFGYINSFGYYTKTLLPDQSPSSISWIGSVQAFFLYLLGVLSGPFSDRYGVRAILLPGSVILILSVMITSLGTEYYQLLLAQGFLGGIANGMLFAPAISCVNQYFTASRAWATGVGGSGGAAGAIVFPFILQYLIPKIGFGWAVRVIGFIMLSATAFMVSTMRELAPRRQTGFFIPGAWKNKPYALVNVGNFLNLLGCYTPIFYVVEYSLSRGMDNDLAHHQVAIFNAASYLGRLVPTFLSDKIGRLNMWIICSMGSGISLLCWTTAESTAGITVWFVFYGIFSGAVFALYAAIVAQVCPNPSDIGTYTGQGLTACGFGVLGGTPINGAIIRRYGYLAASLFSGLMVLLGTIFMIAARLLIGRRLWMVI